MKLNYTFYTLFTSYVCSVVTENRIYVLDFELLNVISGIVNFLTVFYMFQLFFQK